MDRGAWQATAHGAAESDPIQWLNTPHICCVEGSLKGRIKGLAVWVGSWRSGVLGMLVVGGWGGHCACSSELEEGGVRGGT